MPSIDLFQLSHDAVLELLELDFSAAGLNEIKYLCNYSETNGTDVSLGGQTYVSYPFQTAGWEKSSSGTLPTPTVTVSNIFSDITTLIKAYNGLRGVRVTRKKVLAKYLDGRPTANPNRWESLDIFYVSRYSENEITVTFTLSHPLDRMNLNLPRRRMIGLLN